MAVLANNLKRTPGCRPSACKEACKAKVDERSLVACMLQQYVQNECRGSLRGSRAKRRLGGRLSGRQALIPIGRSIEHGGRVAAR
jgi:hypothetical protein